MARFEPAHLHVGYEAAIRMARSRKPNRRGIKIHWNYTVDEVARALGVAKGTVRRWIKAGLPALTEKRPVLIIGADLLDFLKARSASRHRCEPHECYCVKCRAPRPPAGRMADFVALTPTSGNLRALCPECASLMHKRVGVAALEALALILELKRLSPDRTLTCSNLTGLDEASALAASHITDSASPSLNEHFAEERNTNA